MKMEKEDILKEEPKKADDNNVSIAKDISKLEKLKTYVDKLMSSVNKGTKKDVKNAADKLIGACKGVAEKLGVEINDDISDNDVKKFSSKKENELGAYEKIVEDLAKSSDKKEQKLVTSMSNAFPHWCLELAYGLQKSNFYKRLDSENKANTTEDKAEDFTKAEKAKSSFDKLKKKWKNLFSGKARKHETFEKMRKLVVKYSEPWAIAWVNAAEENEPISESSAIKEINALCKKKDVDFITDLGDKEKFKLGGSFDSIFGENFEKNSGKIQKSLRGIIERLVSISKKLTNKKYKEEDAQKISEAINTYKNDTVFKTVMAEPGIFSKAWSKITTAASTVGGGIQTAGGKVLSGAKAVGRGIVKGGRLLGKGALKVATSPKYIIPKKIRNKIYKKFHKKEEGEELQDI